MLDIIIHRVKEDDQVAGLIPHLVEGGESILQDANNTVIVMENHLEKL
jgi:hypothetical protein